MDRWSLVSNIADKAHLLFKSSFAVVYGGKIVRFENKMCVVWVYRIPVYGSLRPLARKSPFHYLGFFGDEVYVLYVFE